MRIRSMLFVAAILIFAVAGCSRANDTGTGPTSGFVTTETAQTGTVPTGQTVWTDELANKEYQTWDRAPGYDTAQPAKGPHGKAVEIYVDDNVKKTLSESGAAQWPTGSKIVKDALDDKGALVSVEYMQKTNEGWYYASFAPNGSINKEGVNAVPCAPCHGRGSDSVLSFKLPSE